MNEAIKVASAWKRRMRKDMVAWGRREGGGRGRCKWNYRVIWVIWFRDDARDLTLGKSNHISRTSGPIVMESGTLSASEHMQE